MAEGPSTSQDATIYEGEDIDLAFTVSGIDATTATGITYKVGPRDGAFISKSLGSGIVATNATTITVTLGTADTVNINGRYHHELRITNASGKVAVAAVGELYIKDTQPSAVQGQYMTLAEAREIVRDSGLQADNETYSDARVDRAIQLALDEVVRRTRVAIASGTVALTATANTVNIQGSLTRFRPERAVRIELHNGLRLDQVDYDEIQQKIGHAGGSLGTGQPTQIAFLSGTAGFLDRTPGTSYPSIKVVYNETPTAWTPGTSNAENLTINVPTEYVRPALWFGAVAALQHTDPLQRFANPSWQRFEDYIASLRGDVGLDGGEGTYDRESELI